MTTNANMAAVDGLSVWKDLGGGGHDVRLGFSLGPDNPHGCLARGGAVLEVAGEPGAGHMAIVWHAILCALSGTPQPEPSSSEAAHELAAALPSVLLLSLQTRFTVARLVTRLQATSMTGPRLEAALGRVWLVQVPDARSALATVLALAQTQQGEPCDAAASEAEPLPSSSWPMFGVRGCSLIAVDSIGAFFWHSRFAHRLADGGSAATQASAPWLLALAHLARSRNVPLVVAKDVLWRRDDADSRDPGADAGKGVSGVRAARFPTHLGTAWETSPKTRLMVNAMPCDSTSSLHSRCLVARLDANGRKVVGAPVVLHVNAHGNLVL